MRDSVQYRRFCTQASIEGTALRVARVSGLLAISLFIPAALLAQAAIAPGPTPSANHRKKPSAATVQPAPAPDWPINSQPKPASVTWSKDALSIDAANSSLQQILSEVASATGASVDGVTRDERVFGTYGPAPARDVLTQLLQGTGYNVVMIGDQGHGVPRQVILSARSTSKAPQGVARSTPDDNEDDFAPEPQYEPPPPVQQPQQQPPSPQQFPMPPRPGFNPGMTPQQPVQQQPGQQPNPQ